MKPDVRLEVLKIVYRAGLEPRLVIETCEQLLPFITGEVPSPPRGEDVAALEDLIRRNGEEITDLNELVRVKDEEIAAQKATIELLRNQPKPIQKPAVAKSVPEDLQAL